MLFDYVENTTVTKLKIEKYSDHKFTNCLLRSSNIYKQHWWKFSVFSIISGPWSKRNGLFRNCEMLWILQKTNLENSGNFQDLKSQITEIHAELCKSNLHWKIRVGIGLTLGGIFGLVFALSRKLIVSKWLHSDSKP